MNNLDNAIKALKKPNKPTTKIPSTISSAIAGLVSTSTPIDKTNPWTMLRILGKEIKQERLKQGLYQKQVASKARCSTRTIGNIEQGWGSPYTKMKIIIALGKELTLK